MGFYSEHDDEMEDILYSVKCERIRQEELKKHGEFEFTCADAAMPLATKLAVLVEEVGEVARALCDDESVDRLRDELVQVAAVSVAWIQALDKQEC